MAKPAEDSARLIWVDAFMAAAAYPTYEEAAEVLQTTPTTIKRRLDELQTWLHRILLLDGAEDLTEDGEAFVEVGLKISGLIDKGGLRNEVSRTRVHADGSVTIERELIRTPEAIEIGELLAQSRARPNPNYVAPPKVSGNDPLIAQFLAEHAAAKKKP